MLPPSLPNARSATLVPARLPVGLTDGGNPTNVGGGVKITFVPRPVPVEDGDPRAAVADVDGGAVRGGSGVRGATYPPIGPPLLPLLIKLLPADEFDGIRKTGS